MRQKKTKYERMGDKDGYEFDIDSAHTVEEHLSMQVRESKSYDTIVSCFHDYCEGFMNGIKKRAEEMAIELEEIKELMAESEKERMEAKED